MSIYWGWKKIDGRKERAVGLHQATNEWSSKETLGRSNSTTVAGKGLEPVAVQERRK
jgi:hypothetical protein